MSLSDKCLRNWAQNSLWYTLKIFFTTKHWIALNNQINWSNFYHKRLGRPLALGEAGDPSQPEGGVWDLCGEVALGRSGHVQVVPSVQSRTAFNLTKLSLRQRSLQHSTGQRWAHSTHFRTALGFIQSHSGQRSAWLSAVPNSNQPDSSQLQTALDLKFQTAQCFRSGSVLNPL